MTASAHVLPPTAPDQNLLEGTGNAALVSTEPRITGRPRRASSTTSRPSRLPLRIGRLPVYLDVRVPLRSLAVSELLGLEIGHVIEGSWVATDDLPLASGAVRLMWAEFEIVDQKLAVRVTRLA